MHSLQLCNRGHTKEASWCKFPVILPVLLASALSSALCSVSDVICDLLLTKLLLHFLLRKTDDCNSSMGVLKGVWWSVQR